MSFIVQRAAWRAARRPLILNRLASTSSSGKAYIPLDIDTNPEPVQDYQYAPPVSRQHLPPYGWDDLQMRRNFGDPLAEHDELMSMWAPDIPPPGVKPRTALIHFLLAVGAFTGIFFGTKWFLTPEPHFIRRTYPYDGLSTELGGLPQNKARIEEESEE
ncbi:hypothetical protein F5878DRAFT_628128 [Lentinula raphanica]|uniref:Uncharacterized protein n=1 Tax=Lentinula raphanica TaxID=153919 RepID=A0AA38P3G1_9AGAR|nr:hypothetical protein F5880DRAFT_1558004 [Lentinula raphanica]KAJ3835363.1 hypothetical protein F5878DRAFT_628128 [Lentinula raphanica]